MKKLLFIIYLFMSMFCMTSTAQIIEDKGLLEVFLRYPDRNTTEENKILLFSVMISTDNSGKIDSVYFSKLSKPWHLSDLIDTDRIIKFYKKDNQSFLEYKNSIIIMPVIMANVKAKKAQNNLIELLTEFRNLYSIDDNKKNKKIVMNTPITIFHETLH